MITVIKLLLIVIHTAICSVFGLIFIFLDRTFTLYHWLSKVFSGGILLISGISIKIDGLENINPKAVYVFVSNHSSQLDITALQWGIPNRLAMIFKKELARIPLFGWQLRLGPYIMIDRKSLESAAKSIEEAKQLMKNKRISVLVFPEGTRSKTGKVQEFKRGAFHLAAKVGYPIVPVTINGTEKILPKGTFKLKRGTIYLHIDKPITTDHIKSKQDEVELMERVRQIIIANKKEY
ncbi:1-acyl-sn-glycerol-3-phosphate acyltransferase [Ignavibacterium album JCM 16511]|uniref:1-acyl-sn-glycerol-3-phosphate acyltransferase n=1 Tax=Ignavibacterium album (strain DSM 19864 / JCM 16511 / NBRC 101810 / Mat9-16) TaxID=945713 RepID=I0AL93_IGNAJ|nr:lysophospholipid acyltransferase family protein [Ignavibacterium album]AFH49750.1 1-acyl-sn-glycerol-3-phosphate acyltransferase [Ignavibacterium album JCM 16511]